jgi:hypothetical protein
MDAREFRRGLARSRIRIVLPGARRASDGEVASVPGRRRIGLVADRVDDGTIETPCAAKKGGAVTPDHCGLKLSVIWLR